MPMYGNMYGTPRDDVADSLMNQQQKPMSTFDYGLAGMGSAAQPIAPLTGPPLQGLPTTPAGGVPGAGLGPAATSIVPQQPQRVGMQGAIPSMPMMGGLGAPPGMARAPGLGGTPPPGQQRRRPGMLY